MVHADEALGIALLALNQAIAAVLADVVVAANLTRLVASEEKRLVDELVGDVVAGLLELRDQAADVPDPGPDLVPFLLREFLRVVAEALDRLALDQRLRGLGLVEKFQLG